jgi:hypothetical protein
MTPIDGLLAELAWSAMDFYRNNLPANASFARILAALRESYGGINKLDPVTLSNEASQSLMNVARSLPRNVGRPEDSRALFGELSSGEQEAVLQTMASRSTPNPQAAIDQGRFLEFAQKKTLLKFFERHPDLFFDGRYWDTPYSSIDYGHAAATDEARSLVVRYYSSLLTDARWLAEQEPSSLTEGSRSRLLRAALAVDLLAPTDGAEEGV